MTMATETQIEKKWHSIERLMNIERIGNRAVKQAQEENRRLGVPNYYSINGKIICDVAELEDSNDDLARETALL